MTGLITRTGILSLATKSSASSAKAIGMIMVNNVMQQKTNLGK